MKRLLVLAGLVALPLTVVAAENPYALFRAQVNDEAARVTSDPTLIEYLRGIYRERWPMTAAEMEAAVRGQPWTACASAEATAQRNDAGCALALENIQLLAGEEQAIRTFGRTVQRIAAAQELPLSETPGRPFHLATDLSGIINIWRAGENRPEDAEEQPALVRTWTPREGSAAYEDLRTVIDDLVEEFSGLGPEQRTAAVARYQYGVRLVAGERAPAYPAPVPDAHSGPGTERQYVFRSWNGIEDVLRRAHAALPTGESLDPPLAANETAYVLLPDGLRNALPHNLLLWMRVGSRGDDGADRTGDAGLSWMYPLEPLLPALLSDEDSRRDAPILGGRYPPEPQEGRGLCSMPLAARGYLCRHMTAPDGQCPDENLDRDAITLLSCTSEEQPTVTVAGADVCADIQWRAPSNEQLCAVGQGEESEYNLVKIRQRCVMGVADPYAGKTAAEQDALCCRLEGEAHLVECTALVNAGAFGDENNRYTVDGVRVTPKVCMEIKRLESCSRQLGRDVRCPVTSDRHTVDDAAVLAAGTAAVNDPEKRLRIEARMKDIERYRPLCAPGTSGTYKNTIGNNACYIGQCVEETLELHRVTGGRSPATVGDGAFPWDDPRTGSPLALRLQSVPDSQPSLPSYRPQAVQRTLEDALCQLQGLPASTPPHLCAFSPSRRLTLPLTDAASTARSIGLDALSQREATLLTEALAAGLGSRIGTDMQGRYLRIGTRTLSEVVSLANGLLRDTLSVRFPADMCPLAPK